MKSLTTLKLTSASSSARADLAQAVADVGLGEPAAAAELLERVAEAAGNAFEHASPSRERGLRAPRDVRLL